jgi:hypothetical protein
MSNLFSPPKCVDLGQSVFLTMREENEIYDVSIDKIRVPGLGVRFLSEHGIGIVFDGTGDRMAGISSVMVTMPPASSVAEQAAWASWIRVVATAMARVLGYSGFTKGASRAPRDAFEQALRN